MGLFKKFTCILLLLLLLFSCGSSSKARDPEAEPEQTQAEESIIVPEPTPAPEPVPEPAPAPSPLPVPEPTPAPVRIPVPVPQPQPEPEPLPEPEPEPVPEPAPQPVPEPEPEPEEETFDPESVTEDMYNTALTEVQSLIADLNSYIRARNYNLWIGNLSESFYATINSAAFLEERTEDLYRRDQILASARGLNPNQVQKTILATAWDYFEHIVVPSRQNDRVDEILFVTESRVRAYTVDSRGNRLILYELEKIDGVWKIVN